MTANSLLQVEVNSVTGREDSVMNSLDFCYRNSILGEGEIPLNIFADGGPLKKSLNVLH